MGDFAFDHERVAPSLATMDSRFDAVAERVLRGYGLRLPRHLAVFAAFLDGIGDAGRRALADGVGLSPGGITRYFEDGGLALTGRDGLDERLDSRFRCDPPEFVTVLWGDSDGLHFGLWYDDPAELPTMVVHNYARDSAETWSEQLPTVLAQVGRRLDDADMDAADDPDYDEPDGARQRAELRRAVAAYADADERARDHDGAVRWVGAARPPILGGVGPALPDGSGDPRGGHQRYNERYEAYRAGAPQVREWIAQAERELAAGEPAYALVLGRELHWFDADAYRADSLRLLASAYRALGRQALAEIAEVHHAHRDLRSVDVLRG
ncbi:ADP-ribosylation family protein [Catellatospora sp. NPDC049609]|uniref:ADP-ribosylation family protein n=1 Tax=Catellatospora sp. NPDC049609 TaxID=3155505 RepID=UPI0034376B45